MDILGNLAFGFSIALSPINLLYCLIGVTLGTAIGVLPGIGPIVTISVLMPLTFGLEPSSAIIMLSGIYYGAQYGGSITSILLNLPGETSTVITCIDGYQMASQGRAGPALAISAIGSLFAGCVGTLLIAILSVPLIKVALSFNSPEYFSLMVVALCASSIVVQDSMLKGISMALLGILFGMSGVDINSGVSRFTFGLPNLVEGINFGIVAAGLFALSEIVATLGRTRTESEVVALKVGRLMLSRDDIKTSVQPILRGTAVGSVLGIFPGIGPAISSFAAYILEKRVSKTPERFGRGAIEGVAAPESANNAAAQTSFIPTLTLGLPGSATMALLLGAMIVHGVTPGPQITVRHPDVFWGLIASMWVGNVFLVLLNLPMVGFWVRLISLPYRWLYPAILLFACMGIYSLNNSSIDVIILAGFGLIGYVLIRLKCDLPPFILGFVLGPLLEENLRRSLLLSKGDPTVFVTRPISATFLAIALALVVYVVVSTVRRRRNFSSLAG